MGSEVDGADQAGQVRQGWPASGVARSTVGPGRPRSRGRPRHCRYRARDPGAGRHGRGCACRRCAGRAVTLSKVIDGRQHRESSLGCRGFPGLRRGLPLLERLASRVDPPPDRLVERSDVERRERLGRHARVTRVGRGQKAVHLTDAAAEGLGDDQRRHPSSRTAVAGASRWDRRNRKPRPPGSTSGASVSASTSCRKATTASRVASHRLPSWWT